MNMFLDGLSDEDFRGWKYEWKCHCDRCVEFEQAAFYIVNHDKETSSQQP